MGAAGIVSLRTSPVSANEQSALTGSAEAVRSVARPLGLQEPGELPIARRLSCGRRIPARKVEVVLRIFPSSSGLCRPPPASNIASHSCDQNGRSNWSGDPGLTVFVGPASSARRWRNVNPSPAPNSLVAQELVEEVRVRPVEVARERQVDQRPRVAQRLAELGDRLLGLEVGRVAELVRRSSAAEDVLELAGHRAPVVARLSPQVGHLVLEEFRVRERVEVRLRLGGEGGIGLGHLGDQPVDFRRRARLTPALGPGVRLFERLREVLAELLHRAVEHALRWSST